jgi:two-component system, NarL family, invasion response regulator UvrY
VAEGRDHRDAAKSESSLRKPRSDRESEVMRLIVSGKSVGDIAKNPSLSVKPVSTYRTRVLQKLHLRHNAELTDNAVVNKLIY